MRQSRHTSTRSIMYRKSVWRTNKSASSSRSPIPENSPTSAHDQSHSVALPINPTPINQKRQPPASEYDTHLTIDDSPSPPSTSDKPAANSFPVIHTPAPLRRVLHARLLYPPDQRFANGQSVLDSRQMFPRIRPWAMHYQLNVDREPTVELLQGLHRRSGVGV